MTRTRYTMDDLGGALSWGSLRSFIHYLGTDSALARDLNKATGWENTLQTNALLADIYDILQTINANFIRFASKGKKNVKVKPYPRPGKSDEYKRKIGKGALPYDELRKWIKEKQNGRRG